MSRAVPIFLLSLSLAVTSLAQSPVSDLDAQLTVAKQQLTAPTLTPVQRVDLITRCDELERRLIAAAPADDRVPSWLADRAAAALDLAGLESGGGADLAVLFGVPTRAQLAAVRSRAAEALDLASRADVSATQAIARLEAQLVGHQASADAVERTLHTLIDVEQSQRIPYLKALATLLAGAAAIDEPARDTAQAAAKLLGSLPPPTPPTGPLAQARALALGAALIHASIGLGDRSADALKAAAAQLQPIAKGFKTDAPSTPESLAALKARLALIRASQDVAPRTPSGTPSTERELTALESQARAASFLDRAAREPIGRNLLISSAIRELLSVAETAPLEQRDALRLRAYDQIAAAIPASLAIEKLPPEATLARAISRARDASANPASPDLMARDDALALLSRLADRADASPALRSQARWERAVIFSSGADPIAELDALTSVIRIDADSENAVPAARRLADLFAQKIAPAASQPAPPDPIGAMPDAWKSRLIAWRDALLILLARDTLRVDRWRAEAARLITRDLAAPLDLPTLDRVLDLASAVAASGSSAAFTTTSEALWRAVDARRGRAIDATDRAATTAPAEWAQILPLASRALAWSRSSDPVREPGYTLLLGESLTGSGDAQGSSVLSGLTGGPIDRADAPLWPRFKLALARAQRAAGQDAAALATLREVADRLEGAPGSSARDPAYWSAWAEMLDLQQSRNTGGERSADIKVQLKRLELLDPKLGGTPFADRIAKVRAAVGE